MSRLDGNEKVICSPKSVLVPLTWCMTLKRFVEEYGHETITTEGKEQRDPTYIPGQNIWFPLSYGLLKLNRDASFKNERKCGICWGFCEES